MQRPTGTLVSDGTNRDDGCTSKPLCDLTNRIGGRRFANINQRVRIGDHTNTAREPDDRGRSDSATHSSGKSRLGGSSTTGLGHQTLRARAHAHGFCSCSNHDAGKAGSEVGHTNSAACTPSARGIATAGRQSATEANNSWDSPCTHRIGDPFVTRGVRVHRIELRALGEVGRYWATRA